MPIRPPIASSPIMDVHSRNPPYMMTPDFRIYLLNKRLQSRTEECDNIWWDAFTTEFFEDKATLTLSFFLEDGPKRYTIGRTLIPRFFRSLFEGGVSDLYFHIRNSKDMYLQSTNGMIMESHQASMISHHVKPIPTQVSTDGLIVIEFSYDELMRIRSFQFSIRNHSELISKYMVSTQDPAIMEDMSKNITRQGLTQFTLNYMRLCVILEPMRELMSRHKTYKMDPRDCLRNCLFTKWQRMMNPPENSRPPKRNQRKRKPSATTANPHALTKKKSFTQAEVMVVGEPAVMGGEFGEEDERPIRRLENTQFENGPIKSEAQEVNTVGNFPSETSPSNNQSQQWAGKGTKNNQSQSGGGDQASQFSSGQNKHTPGGQNTQQNVKIEPSHIENATTTSS